MKKTRKTIETVNFRLYFILSDDDFEIQSKIYSFNCLSCFYSYLELQDDFIFRNLFLFINFLKLSAGRGFCSPLMIQLNHTATRKRYIHGSKTNFIANLIFQIIL